jgi:hypothetical protein
MRELAGQKRKTRRDAHARIAQERLDLVLVLVLVVVLVLDQSAFSAAKRARLPRNYFVEFV